MKMSAIRGWMSAALLSVGFVLAPMASLASSLFTFQGQLQQDGVAINGDVDLNFRIYEDNLGNSQLGSTYSVGSYPVVDGILTIDLGFSGVQFSDYAGRWLEIEVDGQVLSPLIEILPAPYADSTNSLKGYAISSFAPQSGQVLKWNGVEWRPQDESGGATYSAGSGLVLSSTTFSVDFAGSGVASTASRSDHDHFGDHWTFGGHQSGLYVVNNADIAFARGLFGMYNGTKSDGAGVWGVSNSPDGGGVLGQGTVGVRGIAEYASASGAGVLGQSKVVSGVTTGVQGEVVSPDGTAVLGIATATGAGNSVGVHGSAATAEGIGVLGVSSATAGYTTGVRGEVASPNGTALRGEANFVGSGAAIGVYGSTGSDQGIGVYGQAINADAFGMLASNPSVGGTALAAFAQAESGDGIAVNAQSAALAGAGVLAVGNVGVVGRGAEFGLRGETLEADATGVIGVASGTSGVNVGVRGRSASDAGIGVFAENTSTTGPAQALFAANTADGGVVSEFRAQGAGAARAIDALSLGTASDANALRARLPAPAGTGDAIRAIVVSSTARAGRFENTGGGSSIALAGDGTSIEATGDALILGDVAVFGTLSKGGGSFRIDHPLDPANKFLLHSFVESPDMMNVYNGNIVTDAQGLATVELPDWFEALNRDFRYQLTVIGEFAQAIVAEKVHDNRFVIRSSIPGVEVSWQVTGIRQDDWANAHRIPLEVDKQGADKGRYLHPLEHGKSAALQIAPGFAEPRK